MSIFDIFSSSLPSPNSYEEAYNLSYELVHDSPKKAIKVIKSIYEQNLPVEESDIFYLTSIAALASRPIYREMEICKNLLKKVIAIKQDDFKSNSLLFSLSLAEENFKDAREYGINLLNADYQDYINKMEPCSKSELPEVSNYLQNTAEIYQNISSFFLEDGNYDLAIKAIEISHEISPIEVEDNDEFITALFENAILQTRSFISKVQKNISDEEQLSILLQDLISISLAIIFHHLDINNMERSEEQVKGKYKEFICQQSGIENMDELMGEMYVSQLIDKIDFFRNYLEDDEEKFAGKIMEYFYDNYEEMCDKNINEYCKYLVINIRISMIHFGIYSA
jgi:tetratricopeptide (TPR) repeat protein